MINQGILESRYGAGSYVSELDGAILDEFEPPPEASPGSVVKTSEYAKRLRRLDSSPILERTELRYDFRYGLPIIGDFPFQTWSRIVARRAMIGSVPVLGYGEAAGYLPLRVEIAEYLRRARGISCTPEQVIITSGSQQALDLTSKILTDRGDRVVLEEPSYEGARQVFSAIGARIVAVPVDGDGLQVSRLPGLSSGVKAVYVTPSHQFPTGAVLSKTRRVQLLDWARDANSYVIEDDYDGELRYDIRNIAAIKGMDSEDRVIYIGTLSKVLFPSLRLGYLVSPRALVDSFITAKHVTDRLTPALLQMSLADFMVQGHFGRHIIRAKRICAQRRTALMSAVDEYLKGRVSLEGTNAGIHVMMWINGRSSRDVPAIVQASAEQGVGVYPIEPYFMHPPKYAGLILGYASMEENMIHDGIKRFSEVLKNN